MTWKVGTVMSVRREFVELAAAEGANMAELCRRFGVSRKTGHKWLNRFRVDGEAGLADRSRRPQNSPGRLDAGMEALIVQLREQNPVWGARKLRRQLLNRELKDVPAGSTITEVLRRHGLLETDGRPAPRPFKRFERERPNELWQMDFKGHFALANGGRCHPLTVLDDHSRFSVVLQACANEQGQTVQSALVVAFRRYGLPEAMLMDNGSPWGADRQSPWTPFSVWLLKLGVRVAHGRPYHPQTQGKAERFHRTFKAEVLQGQQFRDLSESQVRFNDWRTLYNFERPHEALEMEVPGHRFQPSTRPYPERLPRIEFGPTDEVRKVQQRGALSFHGQTWHVSKAFIGERVGLRPTLQDGVWEVWFSRVCLGELNLREEAVDRRVVRRRERE